MKNKPQSARFDESETDNLIANFGANVSPENWHDLQSFLSGQKEQFMQQERQRRDNDRQRSSRSL